MKPLALRDEIHGDMQFTGVVRRAIDHEFFQRLRYIKQLGLAEYVFPCSTHTRFQHSLGASFLAGKYFNHLISSWSALPKNFQTTFPKTVIFAEKTRKLVGETTEHLASREFWYEIITLAALLHDVGHGPWSHTFEELELPQDYSNAIKKLPETLRVYFENLISSRKLLSHEDISILYVAQIVRTLDVPEFLIPVAGLINKKLAAHEAWQLELQKLLKTGEWRGGVEFHSLLSPLISGPFDVDRIDYIQRDGRNCGVHIGAIEWNRIISKVVPCLAEHQGQPHEPRNTVLLSNIKNQNVLDDFSFSLFQMYAQVYQHPKIVGFEEAIKRVLTKKLPKAAGKLTINFEMHAGLSDERFRILLKDTLDCPEIEDLLFRKEPFRFKAVSFPTNEAVEQELKAQGFYQIPLGERPMVKDNMGVFLYLPSTSEPQNKVYLSPWQVASPIAEKIQSVSFSPRIWIQLNSL